MRKLIIILLTFMTALLSAQIYIAPTGNDVTGDGSIGNPYATLQEGINNVTSAGDTIFMRGGTYESLTKINYNPVAGNGVNGTSSNYVVIMSYPGEWAVIDCARRVETYGMLNGTYNQALLIQYAQYIKFKDFEIKNVFQLDSVLTGAVSASYSRHLTFDHVVIHQIGERGVYIESGAWKSYYDDGDTEQVPYWNDNTYDTTRFINMDIYDLCDSITNANGWDPGNGADAFKTIHYRGNHVIFEGCRMWNYTDDATDPSLINGATVTIDNCWAMPGSDYSHFVDNNGDTIRPNEQNGIKLAGMINGNPWPLDFHGGIVRNCLAMFGDGTGFLIVDASYSGSGNYVFMNNTSYYFEYLFQGLGESQTDTIRTTIYRNNLAYYSTTVTAIGDPYLVALSTETDAGYPESNNTWDWSNAGYPDWVITDTVTVTDEDFATIDSTTLVSLFTASRNSDNSLPTFPLRLSEGSDLIDAGTQPFASDSVNFSIDFYGLAPDIGAFEWSPAVPSTPVKKLYTISGVKQIYWIDGVPYIITVNE